MIIIQCPDCSQGKESEGIGLCRECYQILHRKLKAATKELHEVRKVRNDLVNAFQHVHKAKTVNTELVDECLECGLHWRNPVHQVV